MEIDKKIALETTTKTKLLLYFSFSKKFKKKENKICFPFFWLIYCNVTTLSNVKTVSPVDEKVTVERNLILGE